MNTFQWIITVVYCVLLPLALAIAARFSDLPYISDGIDFPTEQNVIAALCAAGISAGKKDWHLHPEIREQAAAYIRNYVHLVEGKEEYRKRESSNLVFHGAALMSLVISCLSWLLSLPCGNVLKIIFGAVALFSFAVVLLFWDWSKFPSYKSVNYRDKEEYVLRQPYENSEKAEVEVYFERLYYKYDPIVRCQIDSIAEYMGRARVFRVLLAIAVLVSAFLHLPH